MRMQVIRDERVKEGAEERHVGPEGVTWVVNPRGISEAGARAFEACWAWLVAQTGLCDDELQIISVIDPVLPPSRPIRFCYDAEIGVLEFYCNPRHFSLATVNGAMVEHREGLEAVTARSA